MLINHYCRCKGLEQLVVLQALSNHFFLISFAREQVVSVCACVKHNKDKTGRTTWRIRKPCWSYSFRFFVASNAEIYTKLKQPPCANRAVLFSLAISQCIKAPPLQVFANIHLLSLFCTDLLWSTQRYEKPISVGCFSFANWQIMYELGTSDTT